jgi:hypothetical protein
MESEAATVHLSAIHIHKSTIRPEQLAQSAVVCVRTVVASAAVDHQDNAHQDQCSIEHTPAGNPKVTEQRQSDREEGEAGSDDG